MKIKSLKANKVFFAVIISFLACMLVFAVKTFAAGDAYLSDSYIEITEGQTYNIMLTANNAAGRYSVYTDGTVSANGSGWLDNESVEISIYGGSVGTGTVTINLDDFATYDEEPLAGTRTVTVNVVPANNGYAGEEKGEEEQPTQAAEEVTEETAPADPSLEARRVSIDGVEYIVINDLAGIEVPAGFTPADAQYNGENVKTLKFGKDLEIYLLQKVEDGSLAYKVFDGHSFKDINALYQADQVYIILNLEEGYEIPEGYTAKDVRIGNDSVKGFVSEDKDKADFAYVRALKDGSTGIYSFDTKEGSLQRVVDFTSADKTKESVKDLEDSKKAIEEAQKKERALKIGLIDAIVLLMVFAVIMIIILVKKRKRRTVNDIFSDEDV